MDFQLFDNLSMLSVLCGMLDAINLEENRCAFRMCIRSLSGVIYM